MKKILSFFLLLFVTLGLFILFQYFAKQEINQFSYVGRTQIILNTDARLKNEEAYQEIKQITAKFGVNISRLIWHDSQHLAIYTTDGTLKNNIFLQQGSFPAENSDTFISNRQTEDPHQVGKFNILSQNFRLEITPFSRLQELGGYIGIFYLDATNIDVVKQIKEEFSAKLGKCEIFQAYAQNNILEEIISMIHNYRINAAFLLLCFFLYSLFYIYYILRQAKKIGILQINGYTDFNILKSLQSGVISAFAVSICINLIFLFAYLYYCNITHYIFRLTLIISALYLFLYIYSLLLAFFYIKVQAYMYNQAEIIKGKRPFAVLFSLQLAAKMLVLIYLVFCISLNQSNLQRQKKELKNNEQWQEAQNVYLLRTSFITNKIKERRPLEIRAANLYRILEKERNLFLLNTQKYKNTNNLEVLNEKDLRAALEEQIITVNRNYLKRHPVFWQGDKKISEKDLLVDNFTLNVLVPKKLQKFDNLLKDILSERFHFQKVEVANIYHKEFKEELEKIKQADLRINIIYIADDNKYFTYDENVEKAKGNIIYDPIVVVDTANIDASYYYAYLTSSCYYYSQNSINPISEIMPYIQKLDLAASYNSVASVYNQRGAVIANIIKNIKYLHIITVLLIGLLFLTVILFTVCYFTKNRYSICVKRLHGYNFGQIHGLYLLFNIGITCLFILPSAISMCNKLLIVTTEIIVIFSYGMYLQRKILHQVLQEGK